MCTLGSSSRSFDEAYKVYGNLAVESMLFENSGILRAHGSCGFPHSGDFLNLLLRIMPFSN